MPVNYHTHTFRCGHAENVPDEAYLQRAIEQGFTVLGFSDHTPWQGLSPAVCRGVRMLPECEYFPGHMDYLREIRPQVDYLILGNHFQWADPEHPRAYTAAPMLLEEYLTTTLAGMRTGLYAYLAHPDLIYTSQPVFDETCREAAYTLCEEAKKLDLPLEYNLYGVDKRARGEFSGLGYPCAAFWEIAAKTGVRAIIGFDAHKLQHLCERARYEAAKQYLEGLGLPLVQRLF